jgi:hypothetical protein
VEKHIHKCPHECLPKNQIKAWLGRFSKNPGVLLYSDDTPVVNPEQIHVRE